MMKIPNIDNMNSAELKLIANQSVDLNRLIASHPEATAEILDLIANHPVENSLIGDSETHRKVVGNKNASVATIINCGGRYPSEVWNNSKFYEHLSIEPDILSEIPSLLEAPECPHDVQLAIALNGTMGQKYALLKNEALHSDVKGFILPSHFFDDALKTLRLATDSEIDPALRADLEAYGKISLPYCLPKLMPMDRLSHSHRVADQIMLGAPYTSKRWPWPTDRNIGALQPIAQINLGNAGNILSADIGEGLLQVWGDLNNSFQPTIRVVPIADLSEPADSPCDPSESWYGSCLDCDINGGEFNSGCPRVEWIPMGEMFLPLGEDFLMTTRRSVEWAGDPSKIVAALEGLGIPAPLMGEYFKSSRSPSIQLGGYSDGDDYARKYFSIPVPPNFKRLLIQIKEDFFEIAILSQMNAAGEVEFEAHQIWYPH